MPVYIMDEVLFDPDLFTEGMTGGPEYSTTLPSTPAGISQANINRLDSISKYDVPLALLSPAKMLKALTFFRARYGMARPFRFKALEDHSVTAEAFGTGNGILTAFQLQVTYTSGGVQDVRKIVKPVAGGLFEADEVTPRANTVLIYVAGVLAGTGGKPSATVSSTTGIVTFSFAPGAGQVLTWTGEFDIPARFGTDRWPGRYDLGGTSEVTLPIWEVLPVEIGL